MAKEDIWGDNDDVLGGKKGSRDINTIRRKRKTRKPKDRGFMTGSEKVKFSTSKGFGGMLKSKKGHHKLPKTGFADMIGKKSKVYKAHGFI